MLRVLAFLLLIILVPKFEVMAQGGNTSKSIEQLLEQKRQESALRTMIFNQYNQAKVFSIDNVGNNHVYLGSITGKFTLDSIFNEYGKYGSKYRVNSIWNEYGKYGSQYSPQSPFNPYSFNPPVIVRDGQIIGRLTVNKHLPQAVSPEWLKEIFSF